MLNEKIEKTLQEHAPATPAGFAERSDAQVLRLMSEAKTKHRFSWKTAIVCAIVLVMGVATALAATVESVNAMLYKIWPEAADALMPVNVACEDQGIRMEVLSAAVREDHGYITFSLQDMEGDRINDHTETYINPNFAWGAQMGTTSLVCGVSVISYDAEEKKVIFAENITRNDGNRLLAADDVSVALISLYTPEYVMEDLLPLLEEYGERTDTVMIPEEAYCSSVTDQSGKAPENLKMLDPDGSLEIPLAEHAWLSGIGWIDGVLHVQLHYDNPMIRISEGYYYYPVSGCVHLQTPEGYNPYDHVDELPGGVIRISWDEDGNDTIDWEEFIFACDPEKMDGLQADITLEDPGCTIKGDWTVKVPLRMIMYTDE